MTEYEEHLQLAKKLALAAGEIIRKAYHKPSAHVSFKAPTDLVTETDQQCETLIMDAIKERFPQHKFVAEEDISQGKAKEELGDDPTWLIDPLDGTINFVHRFPFVAVSIALAVKKEIVIGVVYNPILEELYYARKNHGAYLQARGEEKKLNVSTTNTLKNSLVGIACGAEIGRSESDVFLKRLDAVVAQCRTWRRNGSAALDMAMVASGKMDLYVEKGIHAWDIAAGSLLVTEAGGVVDSIDGSSFDLCHRQVVTCNQELLALFRLDIK
ncbi:hypothetical protein PROFUN_11921 [Planoprotostelium fungivorum]|uniref:Inositol-1-monophosphatase n=1 Tax=Planoprotostelium fungivorum TaxID=1890364 RepID=A0A2P6N8T3_9EUKA|nr:hypothetical protein PROFUN_11921 [Planoprotostelium fungivorum]